MQERNYTKWTCDSDATGNGCYLFDHACKPLLADFMKSVETNIVGEKYDEGLDGFSELLQSAQLSEIISWRDRIFLRGNGWYDYNFKKLKVHWHKNYWFIIKKWQLVGLLFLYCQPLADLSSFDVVLIRLVVYLWVMIVNQ